MESLKSIKMFTAQKHIAIAGASKNKNKFGHVIFMELKKKGYTTYALNPNADSINGEPTYKTISLLPDDVTALIICTKPEYTLQLVKDAITKNIKNIWIQQGAENQKAYDLAKLNGINVIQKKCIFMFAEPVSIPHNIHRFFVRLFGKYPKN